jgi:hypothetical protein
MQSSSRWDGEIAWVGIVAIIVSAVSFFVYVSRGELMLYGDAVAHINIARRVFDSRTPGLLQLGTVWLPLPHLLMMPFLLSEWLWRTGVGGSIPSMMAFVLGSAGVFRLVRGGLSFPGKPDAVARGAAWLAALVFLLNPNLIYMQATAMTEALYLALFVWAVVFFNEFVQRRAFPSAGIEKEGSKQEARLLWSGLCLAGAALTRYDGWLAGGVMGFAALTMAVRARSSPERRLLVKFCVVIALAPIFWLAYNSVIYRNPLEFANGPYSARAIELKTAQPGAPPHPGTHSLPVAALYFLKSSQLNLAEGPLQTVWVLIGLAAILLTLVSARHISSLLLLWVPLPFYMLSIAYGGVPLFMPVWWPFSHYNVRYGLQLLPAFAVSAGVVLYFLIGLLRMQRDRRLLAALFVMIVASSYAMVWRSRPLCYREAWDNSVTRIALERAVADQLEMLPPGSSILMYLGDHVGALQDAGIPLRRTINEGNHRVWVQPSDPDGLWERALADPAQYADYAFAMGNDPVALALRDKGLRVLSVIHVSGQPQSILYYTRGNQTR